MKIFTYWQQKKRVNITTTIASSDNGFMHVEPHQQLQAPDHNKLCRVRFAAPPVDDDHHQPHLPHSFHGSHDIKSPIYSNLLHYRSSIEKNSDANTEAYDMDLLIYQYTLQNAILSIGTLGRERLNTMAAEMDNKDIISTLGVHLVENDLLNVARPEGYCAHLLTTQKVSNDKVHLNEEIMKRPISSIDKVQVKMPRPCSNITKQESKCTKSIISSTFNDATLQEELKRQQHLDRQSHIYVARNYGNPTDYYNLEDEIGKTQQLLTFMSEELDVNKKIVISHAVQNNMEEDLFISNELNLLEKTTMNELLKGLYTIEEGTEQEASSDEAILSKHGSSQGMTGPSRSTKEMMGSARNARGMIGSSLQNVQLEGIMGSSTDAQGVMDSSSAQGILGSSSNIQGKMGSCRSVQGMMSSPISSSNAQEILIGSSKNTQGVMGCSPYSDQGIKGSPILNARGMMGSSCTNTSAQGMMESSSSAKEIMCSSTDRSTIVNTIAKDKRTKFDEQVDNENMATHNCCPRLIRSTRNHHMDLKRLMLAATPNCLAKHMFKSLKFGHRQMQMGSRPDYNYQCKFYKLLRMLGMKQSNIRKRELGPLAVEDAHISKKEDNEQEMNEEESPASSSQNIAESSYSNNRNIIASNENWISTDEYVVLVLGAQRK